MNNPLSYRMGLLICALAMSATGRVSAQAEPTPAPAPEEPVGEATEAPAEQPTDATGVQGEVSAEASADAASAEAVAEAEAPIEAEAPTAAPEDDIIVTGSRVKSTFGATAAPVEKLGRKELQAAGMSNLSDLITTLSSTQGTGALGSVGIGAAGGAASAVNLRGLGAGSTLILLNGRRLNPSAASPLGLSDLNAVPMTAVERIEILKAGAAAIYGADAVAGVINIITRRNLDGLRLEADGQTTSRTDHGEYTMSASFGSVSERSRVLAALSYMRRTELTLGERYNQIDKWTAASGGSPGTFRGVGVPAAPDPDCGREGTNSAVSMLPTPVGMPQNLGCSYWSLPYLTLFPNVERVNGFAQAQFDLSDYVTVFGELVVSRYRGDNVVVPSFNVTPPFLRVPANHIDNTLGRDVQWDGRPLGGQYPSAISPASEDGLRGVIGLRGDFSKLAEGSVFESWQWELFSSIGISRFRASNDDNLREPLQNALNACSDPDNLNNCFNPFYSAVLGTGTPNSQSVIRKFRGRQVSLTDHALQTYNVGLSGGLFQLPGGELGVALGGEIRNEWRTTELDHDANELRYGLLGGNENSAADRSVYSGYLELRWPLLVGLELQTAVRVERYTDTATTPSPFAGLTFAPAGLMGDSAPDALRTLSFRVNASRAFRAPSILDTYPGISTTPTSLQNPATTPPSPQFFPVQSSGNPDLKPQTALTFSGGFTWSPVRQLNLSADYWYYRYTDRIQAQAAQVLVNNAAMLLAMNQVSEFVRFDDVTREIVFVRTKPINVAAPFITSGIDFSAMVRLDGAVFGAAPTDFGVSLGATGTYTLDFSVPRSETTPNIADKCVGAGGPDDPCDVSGKRNETSLPLPALPKAKINFPLIVSMGAHSASVIGHYVSGFADDAAPTATDMARGQILNGQIPAVFTLDLQYGLTLPDVIGKELSVKVGMLNVFDRLPPPVNGLATFAGEVHDPRGRMFYGKVEAEF